MEGTRSKVPAFAKALAGRQGTRKDAKNQDPGNGDRHLASCLRIRVILWKSFQSASLSFPLMFLNLIRLSSVDIDLGTWGATKTKSLMRFLFLRVTISLLIPCSAAFSQTPTDSSECIKHATRLLDEALTVMQKHYYKKESIEWGQLISDARTRLSQTSNCDNAYETVKWCFSQMHERHSFIMPPLKAAEYNGNINSGATPVKQSGGIRHELIENTIAYLDVPWLSTADENVCTAFADSLQQLIADYDRSGINKWIIDLRRNTGGNCWPMLAGLAPLMGNGTYGYFVSDKERIAFGYLNGEVMQGKHSRCTVKKPYECSIGQETIIVLTGNNTSSAGEIVALAFKGLEKVYLYGEPTAGLTTANATYSLSDGSVLVLTVCKEADRNGKICEGRILPDKTIASNMSAGKDDVKTSAVMFLKMD